MGGVFAVRWRDIAQPLHLLEIGLLCGVLRPERAVGLCALPGRDADAAADGAERRADQIVVEQLGGRLQLTRETNRDIIILLSEDHSLIMPGNSIRRGLTCELIPRQFVLK